VHQTPRLDYVLHEPYQGPAGGVGDAAQSDPAEPSLLDSHGNCNQSLGFRLTAGSSGMHTTDIRFIHFNVSRQSIALRAHHRSPQLVQPGPRRLVAAEAQHALQAQRAGAGLLAGDPLRAVEG